MFDVGSVYHLVAIVLTFFIAVVLAEFFCCCIEQKFFPRGMSNPCSAAKVYYLTSLDMPDFMALLRDSWDDKNLTLARRS